MTTSAQLPTQSEASFPELLHGEAPSGAWRRADRERGHQNPGLARLELGAALALTLVVLGVRLWMASRLSFCGTPDSCFYLGLAQGLERTGSFRVHFVYDLLLPHLTLPNSGIEYWRPGTSLLLLPAHLFGGVTLFRGAAMASFAGVAWAAAAWFIARSQPATRSLAMPSYALALLLPAAWTGSLTPDSTLFYAAAVAWFLALFTVRRNSWQRDVLALVCVGVAYLIRNDALLLLLPLIVVLWLRHRSSIFPKGGARLAPDLSDLSGAGGAVPYGTPRSFATSQQRAARCSLRYAACMLAGFAVALLPMHLIYRAVLGTALPRGTSQVLWMSSLSDFNLYGVTLTPASLLAHGLGALLRQRAETLLLIVYRSAAILVGYAALLFVVAAIVGLRERASEVHQEASQPGRTQLPEFAGPLAFAAALLLVYGYVLPAVGVFSALRTVAGVLPWVAVLSMAGLARAVPERRLRRAVCAVLLWSYAAGGVMQTRRELAEMNALGDRDRREAAALVALGAIPGDGPGAAVVMTPDPVQFAVTTGFAAVPLPGNGLDAARAEALALGVTHAILDGSPGRESNPFTNDDRLPDGEEQAARVLGAVRRVRLPEEAAVLLVRDRRSR